MRQERKKDMFKCYKVHVPYTKGYQNGNQFGSFIFIFLLCLDLNSHIDRDRMSGWLVRWLVHVVELQDNIIFIMNARKTG